MTGIFIALKLTILRNSFANDARNRLGMVVLAIAGVGAGLIGAWSFVQDSHRGELSWSRSLAPGFAVILLAWILGPLLIAIGSKFGVDPIHLGSIIVTNVAIGMAAPPIGYCLFIGMAISGLSLGRISRAIWPQIIVMLIVLFLTTYIPLFALVFQPAAR